MAFNPQFKINQMAKDMGLKSKDLADTLTATGMGDVKTQKALSAEEFNVLLQTLTEANQVDDIYQYMDGKTCIPSVKAAEKAAAEKAAAAERAAAEKAAAAERAAAEKAAAEKAAAEKAAAEKAAAEKAAAEKAAAEKAAADKAAAEKAAADKAAAEKAAADKAAADKIAAREAAEKAAREEYQRRVARQNQQKAAGTAASGAPAAGNQGGARRPANGQTAPAGNTQSRPAGQRQDTRPTDAGTRPAGNRPAGDRPAYNNDRPAYTGDRPAGQRPAGDRPAGDRPAYNNDRPAVSGDRPAGQRPAYNSDRPAYNNDRPAQGGFGGQRAGGFGGQQRPAGNGGRDNRGGDRDKGDFNQNAPKEHFQVQATVRGQTPKGGDVQKVPRGATRVVDTRGGESVDLSKYDDKLNSFVSGGMEDARGGSQKVSKKNNQQGQGKGGAGAPAPRKPIKPGQKKQQAPVKKAPLNVQIPDEIVVSDLAARLKVTAAEVVKRLMLMGVMATLNQTVDYDTAALVAEELGAVPSKEVVVSIEERLFDQTEDTEENLVTRAPVVCVMGHVDHGKTSLLDAIRNTHVTAGEAGGITQHIGAYRVQINGQDITFLDTPGHEAFTAMRARGAQATDIAILVVAADDGIMPQTVEAINHAKAAGVDIIVAINKMDKPSADPDTVKQELTKYDLVPEEWGGDVMCVPVSALTHMGIDELLEDVLLVAEVKELKANPERRAKGIVIEAKLDKGKGPVATVLVQNGTLRPGDIVIAGEAVGRVRNMTDHTGRTVKAAGPSVPVEITGLADVPVAGDEFEAVEDERMARELADRRHNKSKEEEFKRNARANLNTLFDQMSSGVKDLNIIVKADVDGTVEAVKASLQKLSNEEVRVQVIHAACGGITEGDVTFAAASNAIIVGFNVRPDKQALDSAERQAVDIRTYRVIYECIEEIEAAMKGMLAPKFRENLLGHAEVRQIIHVSSVGTVAGSYITDGKVTRTAQIRVVRDGIVIFEDKIASLRRFKDDVKEVADGYECGITLERFNDIKEGDVLEAFVMEEISQ